MGADPPRFDAVSARDAVVLVVGLASLIAFRVARVLSRSPAPPL